MGRACRQQHLCHSFCTERETKNKACFGGEGEGGAALPSQITSINQVSSSRLIQVLHSSTGSSSETTDTVCIASTPRYCFEIISSAVAVESREGTLLTRLDQTGLARGAIFCSEGGVFSNMLDLIRCRARPVFCCNHSASMTRNLQQNMKRQIQDGEKNNKTLSL